MSVLRTRCRSLTQRNAVIPLLPSLLGCLLIGSCPTTWAGDDSSAESSTPIQGEPATNRTCQEQAIVLTSPRWEITPTGTRASLHGLHAADETHVWVCGSDGVVLRSDDGGESWVDCSPAGYEKLDFRAIQTWVGNAAEAVTESDSLAAETRDDVACIASSGTPSVILKTTDAGLSWREVFRDETNGGRAAAYSLNRGRTWHGLPQPPGGYRSCVVALPVPLRMPVADIQKSAETRGEPSDAVHDSVDPHQPPGCITIRFLKVGRMGTGYSANGRHWGRLNDQGFHVAFAVNGQVYAAGSEGRFARLQTE